MAEDRVDVITDKSTAGRQEGRNLWIERGDVCVRVCKLCSTLVLLKGRDVHTDGGNTLFCTRDVVELFIARYLNCWLKH
jgi:hypothetical protein